MAEQRRRLTFVQSQSQALLLGFLINPLLRFSAWSSAVSLDPGEQTMRQRDAFFSEATILQRSGKGCNSDRSEWYNTASGKERLDQGGCLWSPFRRTSGARQPRARAGPTWGWRGPGIASF